VISNSSACFYHSYQTLLNDLSKEVGCKVTIGNFVRMEVGEGIERYRVCVCVCVCQMSFLTVLIFVGFHGVFTCLIRFVVHIDDDIHTT
jgi:hypothetical protein